MNPEILNVRFAKVISIDDDCDADRIKVRIEPEDNELKDNELPFAFPLLPKMIHIKPKVGEAVLVLLSVATDAKSERYYIGPVITQDHKMYYEDKFLSANAYQKGHIVDFEKAPSTNPEVNGALPNDDDVVIRGRKNADIQITEDDLRLRAGVKMSEESNKEKIYFNETDPAYIKLKYHNTDIVDDETGKQCNSTATIVANKINLISNFSDEICFETQDKTDLITDDELKKVLKEAYKLPYGEKLVEILSTIINAFLLHTHRFIGLPPCEDESVIRLRENKATLLDEEKLLSDTVRIN